MVAVSLLGIQYEKQIWAEPSSCPAAAVVGHAPGGDAARDSMAPDSVVAAADEDKPAGL